MQLHIYQEVNISIKLNFEQVLFIKKLSNTETELKKSVAYKKACNCYENENDNGKTDHINKTSIDLHIDIKTNIQNAACLGKTMSLIQ